MTRRDLARYPTRQTFYASIDGFLEANLSQGISTIDFNGSPLDLFTLKRPGAKTTVVVFHAAVSLEATTPVFVGLNVTERADANVVFLSDPSLEFADDLKLGWFAGSKFQTLQDVLPVLLRHVLERLETEHVIFYGPSGGGFAALYNSMLFPSSCAVVANPQTNIKWYEPSAVAKYLEVCWPGYRLDDLMDLSPAVTTDLVRAYGAGVENSVAYLQNRTDFHTERHARPFMEQYNSVESGRIMLGDWGAGHHPPPRGLVMSLLEHLSLARGDWSAVLDSFEFVSETQRRDSFVTFSQALASM